MGKIARIVVVGILTMLMLPLATAGSRGQPEVTDPRGDTVDTLTGEATTEAGTAELDIISVWLTERSDAFQLHVRVADLDGAFRDDATNHYHTVTWEAGDYAFQARLAWDRVGGEFVHLNLREQLAQNLGPNNQPQPDHDHQGDASIAFVPARDEIVATFPREFHVHADGQQIDFNFVDGTQFQRIRALTQEAKTSTASGCNFPCIDLDTTATGSSFTFGRTVPFNPFLRVTADSPVVEASPGQPATATFSGRAIRGEGIAANLTAEALTPGWSVTGADTKLLDLENGPTSVSFQVTAPSDAVAGTTGVVRVTGGDAPADVLFVVGEGVADQLNDAISSTTGQDSTTTRRTDYLQGITQRADLTGGCADASFFGEDFEPIRPAFLVPSKPTQGQGDTIYACFADGVERKALGIFQTDPIPAGGTIVGPITVSVPVEWEDINDLRLVALVGGGGIPTLGYAQSGIAPPGVAVVGMAGGEAASSGNKVLTATLAAAEASVAPGQPVSVSLFLEGTSSAEAEARATVYGAEHPARLSYGLAQAVPGGRAVNLPEESTSLVAIGLPTPADLGRATDNVTATIGTGASSATVVTVPQDLRIGNGSDATRTVLDVTDSVSGAQARDNHTIEVLETDAQVTVDLQGTHGATLYVDNTLVLEAYKVAEGQEPVLVRASAAEGPDQSLVIDAYDLAEHGPGTYEIHVVHHWSTGGEAVDYTLTAMAEDSATIPGAVLGTYIVWPHGDTEPGDVDLTLSINDGRSEPVALTQTLRFTGTGLTLPPVAAIGVSLTTVRADQSIQFTSTSTDPDGTIAAYNWDFGDGGTSTDADPSHTYATPGTYDVTLTVTDNDGATATSAPLRITVLANLAGPGEPPTVQLPGGEGVPIGGTHAYYAGFFDLEVAHKQDYSSSWAEAELSGLIEGEYLGGAESVYVYGGRPAEASQGEVVDGVLGATTPAGATVGMADGRVEVAIGNATLSAGQARITRNGIPIETGALATPANQDDWADGLLEATSEHVDAGGLTTTQRVTLLEGTLHADRRITIDAGGDHEVETIVSTSIDVGADAWVAFPAPDGNVTVTPVDDIANSRHAITVPGTGWYAVFDPDTTDVVGVVHSGDIQNVRIIQSGDTVTLEAQYAGTGAIEAAQYATAYQVASLNATRYAAVQEIARQDANEIGIAYLEDGRAAAVGWAGSQATIDVTEESDLRQTWNKYSGIDGQWDLEVTADATQGGKPIRLILPASILDNGGLGLELDGEEIPAEAVTAMRDDNVLVVTVEIDHFSTRAMRISGLLPGISPWFQYLTFAFGTVGAAGAAGFGTLKLRSQAASRAAAGTPRSAAVQRALGFEKGGRAVEATEQTHYRSALLQRLEREGVGEEVTAAAGRALYARCTQCSAPLRFDAGQRKHHCEQCGTENLNPGGFA